MVVCFLSPELGFLDAVLFALGFMEACGCRHGLFDGANECVAVVVLHSGLPFSSVVRKESAERKPWQYAASAHFWWLTVICCRRFKLVMCWMQVVDTLL